MIHRPRELKRFSTAELLPAYQDKQPRFKDWDTANAIKEGFKASVWVYACIYRIMKDAASVPWIAEEKKGSEWEPAPESPLSELMEHPNDFMSRQDLIERINRLEADGQTALIDAVWEAYGDLQRTGDTEAINAIVVMTDGKENNSAYDVFDLQRRFEQERAVTVVVFTIAFGGDADEGLLQQIARIGNGQFRRAGETDIEELYKIVSTYF